MQRKSYCNEFKAEAPHTGRPGGPYEVLRRWVKEFGNQPTGKAAITPDEHAELIRLRREYRIVKEERDILKKALGIFTKELP